MSAPVTTRSRRSTAATPATTRSRRSAHPDRHRPGDGGNGGRTTAADKAYRRRARRVERGFDAASLVPTRVARRIPFIALLIGMCVAGLALALWLNTSSTSRSYEVTAARAVNQDLRNQKASLEQIVEAGNAAPALAAKAAELGMVQGRDIARLIVAPDGTVWLEGEPTAAAGGDPLPLTGVGRRPAPPPKPAPPPPPPAEEEPAPAETPADRIDPEAGPAEPGPAPAEPDHAGPEHDQPPHGDPGPDPRPIDAVTAAGEVQP